MSQNQNHSTGGLFSFLYRTRVKVNKDATPIVNLSLIFSLLALLSAPWLVVVGAIVAVMMGYQFKVEKNAQGFSDSFDGVVKTAAGNVKSVVDSFTQEPQDTAAQAQEDQDGWHL